MRDEKVLVVGCTGQVALPVARALAEENEVWGLARFRNSRAKGHLTEAGVQCATFDMRDPDLSAVPDDCTVVLDFAVSRTGRWQADLDANVGGLGYLMEHCQGARAFLHCSTSGVYQPQEDHVFVETDALGDNHRPWEQSMPFLSTYSIAKIASEAMAMYASRRFGLPTIITRLGVPYGDNGGWPAFHLELMGAGVPIEVHPERPNRFNPIHETDILRTIPALLDAASVPAKVVHWAGPVSSVEEWCGILGDLTGIDPVYTETAMTIPPVPLDLTELDRITAGGRGVGVEAGTPLTDGLGSMVKARRPDLLGEPA
jgi:nucleoside-diphosphate-sugar epimerase